MVLGLGYGNIGENELGKLSLTASYDVYFRMSSTVCKEMHRDWSVFGRCGDWGWYMGEDKNRQNVSAQSSLLTFELELAICFFCGGGVGGKTM